MTKLECSVKNCLHNADNCCCKAAIAVDGNKAKTAEQTCCASFDENKGGKFTNLFKTPETRLEIACDAVKCVYNEEHRCSAERIDISGDGAASARRPGAVPLRPDRFRIRTGWAGTSYGEPEGVPALLPKTVEGVIKV